MAQASGPASENVVAGSFTHRQSGVNYEVAVSDGKTWLHFSRPGEAMVRGKRELLYYIGQGRRGRTYLFYTDGFVFEAPVNWYADRKMWDMPPAYTETREIPMNLPALTGCLECHGSGIQPPIGGSENRYKTPVFVHPGVSCDRCHGPEENHLKGGAIVNPAKLPARLRDQVCMQCHLEGNVAIEREGRHLYEYKAGEDLSQYVRYFVSSSGEHGNLRAASQFEALAQSACKRKSGETMSCTSCHDPHRTVPAEERASFYRAKCIACHGSEFAEKHHADRPDCTGCHMPSSPTADIAHTAVTDHRILRRPLEGQIAQLSFETVPRLEAFPRSEAKEVEIRDIALAWQSMVESGLTAARSLAARYLKEALERHPEDPALLSSFAYVEQRRGAGAYAQWLYEEALKRDPDLIEAATDLGVLKAKDGHMADAVKLWESAFARAPGRSEIGMNLARSYCAAGRFDRARDNVMRVLEFNPDLGEAKEMIRELNRSPAQCGQQKK